jgi:hypothetical protein
MRRSAYVRQPFRLVPCIHGEMAGVWMLLQA